MRRRSAKEVRWSNGSWNVKQKANVGHIAGLDDRDIVIGYPNIDDTKEAEITKLFGQPGKQSGVSKLNDTGTASPEEPDDPEFGIMISPSSQSMVSASSLNLAILIRPIQCSQPMSLLILQRLSSSITFATLRSCF